MHEGADLSIQLKAHLPHRAAGCRLSIQFEFKGTQRKKRIDISKQQRPRYPYLWFRIQSHTFTIEQHIFATSHDEILIIIRIWGSVSHLKVI